MIMSVLSFPETKSLEVISLTGYLGIASQQHIRILEQLSVDCDWKPNSDLATDVEELDKIESTTAQKTKLDDYIGELKIG